MWGQIDFMNVKLRRNFLMDCNKKIVFFLLRSGGHYFLRFDKYSFLCLKDSSGDVSGGKKNHTLAIAVTIPLVIILLLVIIVFYVYKRKRKQRGIFLHPNKIYFNSMT